MSYLTLLSLLISVLLISVTSIAVSAIPSLYTFDTISKIDIEGNTENWNDNVIIFSTNKHKIRPLSKTEKNNFVLALHCDNNVVLQLHQILSHSFKHQRYSHLALANFQYRFTHSRRQLMLLS